MKRRAWLNGTIIADLGICSFNSIKIILFLLLLPVFSCKIPKFKKVPPVSPFVTLKKGGTVQAEMVDLQGSKKSGTKLVTENNTYLPKNVAVYSNGISTFANIHDSTFAKKVVDGKISLFTDHLNSYGKPASPKPFYFYAHKTGTSDMYQLSHHNMKILIEPDHAANKYLKRYKNLHMVSTIMEGLGLGITAAGLYQIQQDKKGKTGIPSNPSGVAVSAVGVWCFIAFAIVNEENKSNLFRAVKEYDSETGE